MSSKRYKKNYNDLKEKKISSIEEALDFLQSTQKAKFNESVEVHLKLNVNPKKTEQQIRFACELPHGIGKIPRIAVFTSGEQKKIAKDLGVETIFDEKDLEKISENKKNKFDFEISIATPNMMPKIAKIAKILGPRGLMPSPKNGTVTNNLKETIESLKKGRTEVKMDSGSCIHQMIGKISFKKEELIANYRTLIEMVEKHKPTKLKGKLIKTITITTTMGPGLKIDR